MVNVGIVHVKLVMDMNAKSVSCCMAFPRQNTCTFLLNAVKSLKLSKTLLTVLDDLPLTILVEGFFITLDVFL